MVLDEQKEFLKGLNQKHLQAFALTELEADFAHAIGGIISYLRNSAWSIKEYYSDEEVQKVFQKLLDNGTEFNEVMNEWESEIARVSDGKYPEELNKLNGVELFDVKLKVGAATLELIRKWKVILEKAIQNFELVKNIKFDKKKIIGEGSDRKFSEELIDKIYRSLNTSFDNIRSSLESFQKVVTSFSAIDKTDFEFRKESKPYEIVEFIKVLTEFSRIRKKRLGGQNQIDIVNDVPKDLILPINANILLTTLLNAINNSIKAISPKGDDIRKVRQGTIVVSSAKKGSNNLLVVKDNGLGIQRENRKRIFDWGFSTTKTTGLGLPISRLMVRSAGGNVYILSRTSGQLAKRGTDFIVSVPTRPKLARKTQEEPKRKGRFLKIVNTPRRK